MSLLLDARKKSQQAQSAQSDPANKEPTISDMQTNAGSDDTSTLENRARGRNLFTAKSPSAPLARASVSRNLLIALGATVLLLTAGASYVWYITSAGDTQPLRPNNTAAVAPPATPAPVTPNNPAPGIVTPQVVSPDAQPAHTPRPAARMPLPRSRKSNAVSIEQQAEPIDPLLNDAYLAYRSGKFEQAQQLYRQVLNLDARNADALLGMAAIAQHRGSDKEAAHYYSQALVLDPRNAVANAGMSALTTDDNRESRLKNLLNEQRDSSSLHFALGNHYASQARWGEAQQSYSNAYRLEPDNAELAFNLAVSLDRLGKNDLAVQHYQRALQLDQSHSAGFDHAQVEQRVQELTR